MIDSTYHGELVKAFRMLHGCRAEYMETVYVVERLDNNELWFGDVEVFLLTGHPKTEIGYAWADKCSGGDIIVLVLHLLPVTSAETAIRTCAKGGRMQIFRSAFASAKF